MTDTHNEYRSFFCSNIIVQLRSGKLLFYDNQLSNDTLFPHKPCFADLTRTTNDERFSTTALLPLIQMFYCIAL